MGFKLLLRLRPEALRALEDVVQIAMFDGGYIGASIIEDGLVSLCWVMRRDVLRRIGSSWPSQAAYFSTQSELLGDLLIGAKPEWDKPISIAGIPYGYLRRQSIAPGIFPLGDQLAVIPSFTGDGMAIALYSGIAAAQAILAGTSAVTFQQGMLKRLKGQFLLARAANLLFERKVTHDLSVISAALLPGVVTWIAKLTRLQNFEDVMLPRVGGQQVVSS